MKRLGEFLWAWCWLPCLCFLAGVAVWLVHTLERFDRATAQLQSITTPVSLAAAGQHELAQMLRGIRLQFAGRSPLDVDASLRLPSLELFVHSEALAHLDADLPYSGQDYQDALLRAGGHQQEVKLRYQGEAIAHWQNAKKSLRLRTKRDELFLGMRAFSLLAPKAGEQLNSWLGYELARSLALIAPRSQLVNLFVNGRYTGLHLLVEQLEEGTLRAHDRMPGDLYSGEVAGVDAFPGAPNQLFGSAALWDKLAENNHYELGSKVPLQELVRAVQQPADAASMQRLGELLDLDAFARLSVLEQLVQSPRCDDAHNQRLFWDPWRRKFEPVVWDPAGWQASMRPEGVAPLELQPVNSALFIQLHRHAGFLAARARALREFYAEGKDQQLLTTLERGIAAAKAALRADANAEPPDDGAIAAAMDTFAAFVRRTLQEVKQRQLDGPTQLRYRLPPANGGPLLLQVEGEVMVSSWQLQFPAPLGAVQPTLRLLRADGGEPVPLGPRARVHGDTLDIDLPLVAEPGVVLRAPQRLEGSSKLCRALPTSYELQIDGVDLRTVKAVRSSSRSFTATPDLQPTTATELFEAVPPIPTSVLELAGEVHVDGIRRIDQPVHIAAGTRFLLGPSASILFAGTVTADGSEAQPIEFAPAARDQEPWGTVALDGPGSSGSTLRFCRFRGGSGHKAPLCEYTAMLSVHSARAVQVSDCEFRDSKLTDDMIHVVYSQVTFERVLLQRALMDALDCDISEVLVKDSRFVQSGNDGIDLMTTKAVISNCSFDRCGDKGISIGEDTQLCVVDSRFERCMKAMEAKDGSTAAVLHADVIDCTTALNAYKKNWRYAAGGHLTVWRSRFLDNLEMPTADRDSEVALHDCQTDAPLDGRYDVDGKVQKNHASEHGCDGERRAKSSEPPPFPANLPGLRQRAEPVWKSAVGDLRGALSRGQ